MRAPEGPFTPSREADPSATGGVAQLVEHLFRHQAGQVISTLTRRFGIEHLDLAEDVMQDTLLKALRQWPLSGVPVNPGGWILQTAKHLAIDVLRREASFRGKAEELARQLEEDFQTGEAAVIEAANSGLKSDQLRMMFACCHPCLARDAQVSLILKALCGFSITEIARAFLAQEATIAQRIVRAKRVLRREPISFELPGDSELHVRLDAVLEVLYHLQAAIALCHAVAPSYGSTDWRRILSLYDALVEVDHSPVVLLNRAVALTMLEGAAAGIRELERIRNLITWIARELLKRQLSPDLEVVLIPKNGFSGRFILTILLFASWTTALRLAQPAASTAPPVPELGDFDPGSSVVQRRAPFSALRCRNLWLAGC